MKKRHESLLRLQTTFECSETWEDMQGSASCRFCANCQREVIDLAQLTPRQVRARLEAARGKLCARLTRDGSRIRFAEPPAFLPARPRRAGKTSPFAAGLLSAFIGVGSLAAQPASPAAPALTSAPEDEPKPAGRKKAERTPAESTASLGGQLKDFDGKPVVGATIIARQVPGGRHEALREIQASLYSLASMAELEDKVPAELAQLLLRILEEVEADPDPDGDNLRSIFLAAVFTEEHRERLQTAMRTNPGPSADDDEDFLELLEEWNP